MDTSYDLDELTRRTRRKEFEDGLRDFQMAALILMYGLLVWAVFSPVVLRLFIKTLLLDQSIAIVGFIGFVALIILVAFGAERLMARFRRATLWKDSGFVRPLRWTVNRWITLLATLILLAIIIGSTWLMVRGVLNQEEALRAIPVGASLSTAFIFFAMGFSLEIRRYRWVGLAGAILSFILLFPKISFSQTWLWLSVGWAVILTTSGGWALSKALQEIQEGSADE
ncbi:MAG: hypothetical protein GTO18_14625 [Anaerolineales bacterium]|nr:hypothetical protein [Anaerolineales bacterium]